jgi:hypothetical protein
MPDSFVRNTLRLASLAALALAASPLPALAGEPVAHLYWAVTEDAGGVWRAHAGGENPELVVEAGEIPEVGLAPALGLLFYPLEDGAGQGQLWRSDLDGDDRVAIVDGIEEVSDIEIDATGGKVYWSELSGSPASTAVRPRPWSRPTPRELSRSTWKRGISTSTRAFRFAAPTSTAPAS